MKKISVLFSFFLIFLIFPPSFYISLFLSPSLGNKWKCDCDLSWMEQVSKIATNTELLSQLNHSECSETFSYHSEASEEEEMKEKEDEEKREGEEEEKGEEEKEEGRKNWINILKEYLPSNHEECWRRMNPNQGRKYLSSSSPSSSSSSLTSLSINLHTMINLQFFFFFVIFFN